MPLKLVRSESNARLWRTCSSRFLDELDGCTGPTGYPARLWLAHRAQRDLLLDAAEERDLPGWLAPPFSFLSELPSLFGITRRPIGPLTGRLLVSRIAARAAREHGFEGVGGGEAPGRGHMVDRALSDLLPEGISPDRLSEALSRLEDDEFAVRRNRWLLDTYTAYLAHLEGAGQFDPRSIHSMVADTIERDGLASALGGAERLHVYGLGSLRGRVRLFRALAGQAECEVVVYLPDDETRQRLPETGDAGGPEDRAADEWERMADDVERVSGRGRRRPPRVQPVPDAVREVEWVSTRVKHLLAEGEVRPHEIAVIARSGRDDTRRVHEALERIGVPSTARLRSRLHEVPALRALLQLFSAVTDGWAWTPLRAVLASPYLGRPIDLRAIDVLAARARPHGFGAWIEGLGSLEDEARSDRGWVLRRSGVTPELIERARRRIEGLAAAAEGLLEPRDEAGWIGATRGILRGEPFDLREAAQRVVDDRWDIVRLDQRAMLALDDLLREWSDLVADSSRDLEVGEWYSRLRRLLEANEIAITTPSQRGVQVLEAHEAGLTPFRHAFVVHANEGVFPPRPGGGLFTDGERETLASAGLPISTRDLSYERERRLWLSCIGSERVHISYRTADASGIPRLASLFVPAHDRKAELARTRRALPDRDTDPESLVTRDLVLESELVRFLRIRRSGRPSPFETPDPAAVRGAALRAFAEEIRSGALDDEALRRATDALADAAVAFDGTASTLDPAAVFGVQRPLSQRATPWNGEIRDPVLLRHIEERFSPAHEWSASQLEQYGTRPFDFLLERVLGLQEIEVADDEASALTVGGLVHSILEAFYRDRIGVPTGEFDDVARSALRAAFDDACREFEESGHQWVGLPHVWAATREELLERLTRFVEWEFGRSKPGTPIEVEFGFGRVADRAAVDLSGPGRSGSELPLRLAGRIDRIDRIEGSADALRIIDYKSGSGAPSPKAFEDGAALQAALYMAVAAAEGLGTPATGSYRTVRRPGDRATRSAADVEGSLMLAREIAARIRAGLFEAVQARSTELRDWQPGRDIARSDARIESGTRFDTLAPMPLPGPGASPPEAVTPSSGSGVPEGAA